MDIQEKVKMNEVNEHLIRCKVGCLDHTLGITYFESDDIDEPELYLETLHAPYHGLSDRIRQAYYYITKRKPLCYDSTMISIEDAKRMRNILINYIKDYNKWLDRHDEA